MQNKYDTNITLEDNSSLTYILKNITPGSIVLEFGPATGYMTRYLKEELKCLVYIVEIDKDAFEKASEYAQDGICGSAEESTWCERFQEISFDYITFADVLEHLMNPWQVLEWSVNLLNKNTGRILVSIPNIGHNAVLIDLFNNKFEYRNTGILDNTHLRFFTHDSVVEMFRKCGLYIEDEDAIFFDLEYAGLGNSSEDVPENVWDELRLREYGFINQFLFTLSIQKPVTEVLHVKRTMSYECALYYTESSEFSEEQKVLSSVQLSGNKFCADFVLDKEVHCRQVMIELFAFPGMITSMTIRSDMNIGQVVPVNGGMEDDNYCFWGNRIQIQIKSSNIQMMSYVQVSGKLETVQTRHLGQCIVTMRQEQEIEIGRLNNVIIEKDKAITSLNKLLDEKDSFIQKIQSTLWYRIFKKQIMKDK